jgi:hypothetical protein
MTKAANNKPRETGRRLAWLVIKMVGLVAAVYIGVRGTQYLLNDVLGTAVPGKVFIYLFIAASTATFGYVMQEYIRKSSPSNENHDSKK